MYRDRKVIKTRKFITPKLLTSLLNDVSKRVFHGNLKFRRNNFDYGENAWNLTYSVDGRVWYKRVCQIVNPRCFKLRFSAGSYFTWWVDDVILNEVAIVFRSYNITSKDLKGYAVSKYDKYYDHLVELYGRDTSVLKHVIGLQYACVPKLYHIN